MIADEDHFWMGEALDEARKAASENEVPVGAVVVFENRVIGRGHNQVEGLNDPTAHAEIIALGAAGTALQSWKLDSCVLYVTLEPCAMCAGAIIQARIRRLVFGAFDARAGACGSRTDLIRDRVFDCSVEVRSRVRESEATELMQEFFKTLRGTDVGRA
jgi:tRNA(adenine34) deaminase